MAQISTSNFVNMSEVEFCFSRSSLKIPVMELINFSEKVQIFHMSNHIEGDIMHNHEQNKK
jgi:hypothetical protein